MKRIHGKTEANAADAGLPPDVTAADLKYPASGENLGWEKRKELGVEDLYELRFYHSPGCGGWVLTTLPIGNASRRAPAGTPARYYGIGVSDSKVYTIGKNPKVKEVVVYLNTANLPRLMRYIELYRKGLADAGQIRDRISSRRAQGQMHRAAGRTHWHWND